MDQSLVAPCGILCSLCVGYQGYTMKGEKRKHTCTGCRDYDKTCAFLKKDCELLREKSVDYCFQCDVFPCDNLSRMDKSYREKYDMSLIENLVEIREKGTDSFIIMQQKKYKCPICGEIICLHTNRCYNCGYKKP